MNWIRLSFQDASGPRDVLCPSCRDRAGQEPAEPPRPRPGSRRARTLRKESLRVYAWSSHESSSSDSFVPHLPFISAPRDSGISACSVISCKRERGSAGRPPSPPPPPRLKILGGNKGLCESSGRCARVCVPPAIPGPAGAPDPPGRPRPPLTST